MTAQRRASSAPAQCSCHAVLYDCCPDRIRGVLDAGASRIGLHATGGAAGGVAGMIDHTLLKPDATKGDIQKLCREAAEFHFATVCVNPGWVALAANLLRGSGVGVCSVVGFPLGATTADVKHYETRRAIFDGATTIDMVINIGALKSGDPATTVERDIAAVVAPCREANVVSEVILESRAADRRGEDRGIDTRESGRRRFCEDVHRVRGWRRDGPRRRAHAPRGRRRDGREGRRRRSRL